MYQLNGKKMKNKEKNQSSFLRGIAYFIFACVLLAMILATIFSTIITFFNIKPK